MATESQRQFLPIQEVAKRAGVCRATIYNMIRRGEGPRVTKIGDRSMVHVDDEAAWHALLRAPQNEQVAA